MRSRRRILFSLRAAVPSVDCRLALVAPDGGVVATLTSPDQDLSVLLP